MRCCLRGSNIWPALVGRLPLIVASKSQLQAQILFLKSPDLLPFRGTVSTILESRHTELRKLWHDTLASVGIVRE